MNCAPYVGAIWARATGVILARAQRAIELRTFWVLEPLPKPSADQNAAEAEKSIVDNFTSLVAYAEPPILIQPRKRASTTHRCLPSVALDSFDSIPIEVCVSQLAMLDGGRHDMGQLSSITEVSEEDARRLCKKLEHHAFIRLDYGKLFIHPLIRDFVRDAIV